MLKAKLTFSSRTVPPALFLACLLSFGLLIPWLGFYWDDWPAVWYLHLLGPAGFRDVFSADRPLLGWLFMLTAPVFGESTVGWQSFGLLTRWLCCLSLWAMLRQIWPNRAEPVAWAALLFAVYPGFQQQYISVTYSMAWIILAVFWLSFTLMLLGLRSSPIPPASEGGKIASESRGKKYFFLAAAWALSTLVMFTDEYFFGLELLRPLFLWLVFSAAAKEAGWKLRRVAALWLPYLASMAAFLVWRLVLHETPRGQVQIFDQVSRGPLAAGLNLVRTALQDMLESSFIAWGQVFNLPALARSGTGPLLLSLAVILVAFGLGLFYLLRFQPDAVPMPQGPYSTSSPPEADPIEKRHWTPSLAAGAAEFIGIGLLALLLGGIPFWATSLPIELRFPWDRFTLSLMLGSSLLSTGLLMLLARHRGLQIALLAAALALAAGSHLQAANRYRREWNTQKSFFWQMTWRVPGLQPGTALLTTELPFTYFSDNSLTAPLNWIYAPQNGYRDMPYLLYDSETRLGARLPSFATGVPIHQPYRATTFTGSTSQALVFFMTPPGCLKIVDPAEDAALPQKPRFLSDMLHLSDPGWVLPAPAAAARPPESIFGPEPEPDWCYYFEKADLAAHQAGLEGGQAGEWGTVARLGDQAFSLGQRLYEVNAPEYLPYIAGYAHTGQWDQALRLSAEAHQLSFRMQRILCTTWTRIGQETAADPHSQPAVGQARRDLKCK